MLVKKKTRVTFPEQTVHSTAIVVRSAHVNRVFFLNVHSHPRLFSQSKCFRSKASLPYVVFLLGVSENRPVTERQETDHEDKTNILMKRQDVLSSIPTSLK